MAVTTRVIDSIKLLPNKHQDFVYKLIKYLQYNFEIGGEDYFYDMIKFIRYVNTNKDNVAWTTPNKEIFLNAPAGANIGEDFDKWEFVYIHECLHQIWDTFAVEDEIKKIKGECIHDLLNVASDCVINDFIHKTLKKRYPTENLITPEFIRAEFGINYDIKTDNQYSLYEKCLPVKERILANQRVIQSLKEPPSIKLPEYDMPGGGGLVTKHYKETTQDWKNGRSKAVYEINEVLFNSYSDNGATNGDNEKLRNALIDATKKLIKLQGEWKKYEFKSGETFIKDTIESNYRTFKQGWDTAFPEVLNRLNELIMQLDPNYEPPTNLPPMPPTNSDKDVPDKDPEQKFALPKIDDDKNTSSDSGGESSDSGGEKQHDKNVEMPEKQNQDDPADEKTKKSKKTDNELDEQIKELQKTLDEDTRTPEDIIKKYKSSMMGTLKEFVKKCKNAMVKTRGVGMAALSPKQQNSGNWAKDFINLAITSINTKIRIIQKQYIDTYARQHRRAGVTQLDQIIKKGRIEKKDGMTLTIKFYVDISGSMTSPNNKNIKNILSIVWGICEDLKKQNKRNKLIEGWNFLVYPFNETINPPLKYGVTNVSPTGGNIDFSELLDEMKDISQYTLLNVIITDAEWPVSVAPSVRIINKEINGNVIYVTNASSSHAGYISCTEIASKTPKFKLIQADANWVVGGK